jgi:hypothetical protein
MYALSFGARQGAAMLIGDNIISGASLASPPAQPSSATAPTNAQTLQTIANTLSAQLPSDLETDAPIQNQLGALETTKANKPRSARVKSPKSKLTALDQGTESESNTLTSDTADLAVTESTANETTLASTSRPNADEPHHSEGHTSTLTDTPSQPDPADLSLFDPWGGTQPQAISVSALVQITESVPNES